MHGALLAERGECPDEGGRVEICLSFKEGLEQTDGAGLFRLYSDN